MTREVTGQGAQLVISVVAHSKNNMALYCIVNMFCYSVREYVVIEEAE